MKKPMVKELNHIRYALGFEDRSEWELAVSAPKLHHVLYWMDTWLRNLGKYGDEKWTSKDIEVAQRVRDRLWEELKDEGVDLYRD